MCPSKIRWCKVIMTPITGFCMFRQASWEYCEKRWKQSEEEKIQQIRAEILVSTPSSAPPTQMWGGGGLLGQQSAFSDKQPQRRKTGGYIRLTARGGGRQAIQELKRERWGGKRARETAGGGGRSSRRWTWGQMAVAKFKGCFWWDGIVRWASEGGWRSQWGGKYFQPKMLDC